MEKSEGNGPEDPGTRLFSAGEGMSKRRSPTGRRGARGPYWVMAATPLVLLLVWAAFLSGEPISNQPVAPSPSHSQPARAPVSRSELSVPTGDVRVEVTQGVNSDDIVIHAMRPGNVPLDQVVVLAVPAGARRVVADERAVLATTDAGGLATVNAPVAGSFLCAKRGFASQEIAEPKRGKTYHVTLLPSGSVTFRFVDARESPIEHVQVVLGRSSFDHASTALEPTEDGAKCYEVAGANPSSAIFTALSSAQGIAVVDSIPNGHYSASVRHASYVAIEMSCDYADITVPGQDVVVRMAQAVASVWRPWDERALLGRRVDYQPSVLASGRTLQRPSIISIRDALRRRYPGYNVDVQVAASSEAVVASQIVFAARQMQTLRRPLVPIEDVKPITVVGEVGGPDQVPTGRLDVVFADAALRGVAHDISLASDEGQFAIPSDKCADLDLPVGHYRFMSTDHYVQAFVLKSSLGADVTSGGLTRVVLDSAVPLGLISLEARVDSGELAGFVDIDVRRNGELLSRALQKQL